MSSSQPIVSQPAFKVLDIFETPGRDPPTHGAPKPPRKKKKKFQNPGKPRLSPKVDARSPKVDARSPKVDARSPKVNRRLASVTLGASPLARPYSHSSVDSPGARTLLFAALEPFHRPLNGPF